MAETLRMDLHALPGSGETHREDDESAGHLTPHPGARLRTQLGLAAHRPRVDTKTVAAPGRPDPRLVLLWDRESPQARSYRVLRHRLLNLDDPRVVGITSAQASEGKTSVAFNLAMAIAEEVVSRVLLVEANVRSPVLAELFDFVPPACFAEQTASLRSSDTLWSFAELSGTKLHIAAVEPSGSRPAFDRVLFGAAMAQLRHAYDYVIVDTPPALDSADVNVVAEGVDGLVFAARARKSSRRALAKAIAQVRPTPVLGLALIESREAA